MTDLFIALYVIGVLALVVRFSCLVAGWNRRRLEMSQGLARLAAEAKAYRS